MQLPIGGTNRHRDGVEVLVQHADAGDEAVFAVTGDRRADAALESGKGLAVLPLDLFQYLGAAWLVPRSQTRPSGRGGRQRAARADGVVEVDEVAMGALDVNHLQAHRRDRKSVV